MTRTVIIGNDTQSPMCGLKPSWWQQKASVRSHEASAGNTRAMNYLFFIFGFLLLGRCEIRKISHRQVSAFWPR